MGYFSKILFIFFCSRLILKNSNKEEQEENIGFSYQIIGGKLCLMLLMMTVTGPQCVTRMDRMIFHARNNLTGDFQLEV